MAKKALVSIGNYDFPTPSTYIGLTATVVDSARNAEGKVIGTVIRDDVGKVEMLWSYITVAQWSDILKKFTRSAGGSFYVNVTFYDQVRAAWITREMYVSDRATSGAFMLDEKTGAPLGWVDAKLSLVEV